MCLTIQNAKSKSVKCMPFLFRSLPWFLQGWTWICHAPCLWCFPLDSNFEGFSCPLCRASPLSCIVFRLFPFHIYVGWLGNHTNMLTDLLHCVWDSFLWCCVWSVSLKLLLSLPYICLLFLMLNIVAVSQMQLRKHTLSYINHVASQQRASNTHLMCMVWWPSICSCLYDVLSLPFRFLFVFLFSGTSTMDSHCLSMNF